MSTLIEITCQRCGKVVTRAKGQEGRGKFCSIRCGRLVQHRPSREERYWAKVVKGPGCWDWTGMRSDFGYGLLKSGPRGDLHQESAHRVSWEIHYGLIPAGLFVLHHCDNPPCSNPEHLYIGTQADNVRDRDTRGRANTLRGSAVGTSKMTEDQIRAIRKRRREGALLREIATEFGLSIGAVDMIARGRTWKHVE